MLARIRFILFAIYYLPRFAWRMFCVDVLRVTILFEVLRFLMLHVCYFRNTREWNSRHLHRDDASSTWLQIVQVSSTTNQVVQTARLSRNPDVCVHVLDPFLDVPRPFSFKCLMCDTTIIIRHIVCLTFIQCLCKFFYFSSFLFWILKYNI